MATASIGGVDKFTGVIVMAKNALKSDDVAGFLRAYTDEIAELEKEHQVIVFATWTPARQRGVLEFRLSAWAEGDRRGNSPRASYTAHYPNAFVGSLHAFLFQCAIRLGTQLRDLKRYPQGKA